MIRSFTQLLMLLCSSLLVIQMAVQNSALACSAFRMPTTESHILVGRNFDWDYGHGLIVMNKRGIAKRAIVMHPSDTVTWTSKYGSLTFNQAGRELPYGGVNEKGLMIEVLWLGYTAWPVTSAPSINETQWIQYQLDLRSSVADLIAHIDDVRILSVFAKIHFIACDATGACASIEGLGDHVEIHTGASMPIAVLTNDQYVSSVAYASKYPGDCANIPAGAGSLERFARAACSASTEVPGETPAAETVRTNQILDSVAQGSFTKWRIVYDLTEKSVSIRTLDAPVTKTISLAAFDFSCATPVSVLDLNATVAQPVDVSTQFVPYTQAANRVIVEKSLVNGFAHLPAALVEKIVKFPETLACVSP